MLAAKAQGLIADDEYCILDSTAHALKFMDFQNMYFSNTLPAAFGVTPNPAHTNTPQLLLQPEERAGLDEPAFVKEAAARVASTLGLETK